ncbi:MAG: COQ9 family protein [Azospirillum brasilense]|nr:MAG: COQ9 family protein [Azospirillum brasilense]
MSTLADRIVDAALPNVPFDGWSVGTLEKAAQSIGATAFDVKRTFPRGVVDAVNHFVIRANDQMIAGLPEHFATLKIREKITTAVMVRLRQQLPHREAVRRALAVYAMPWNAADGLQRSYDTVDVIWRAAGDTSLDYNFYTKRLTLAKVYAATLMVWLNDDSAELADTEAFLRRRIDDVMQFEKFKAKAKQAVGSLDQWMPKFKA